MVHRAWHPKNDVGSMCREKKEEIDSLALRTTYMQQSKDARNTLKNEPRKIKCNSQ